MSDCARLKNCTKERRHLQYVYYPPKFRLSNITKPELLSHTQYDPPLESPQSSTDILVKKKKKKQEKYEGRFYIF